MLNTTIKAKFIDARVVLSPIPAAFTPLGTPVDQPLRILKISNTTDQNISLSTDGVTIHDYIPANGFVLYDLGTNRASMGSTLQFPALTQFYIAADVITTSGLVILTGIYSGV
jgi:hypothetical protein